MIGKRLGHYEITSQLGKGGMGEVYQAKDNKLGRDVGIKVLPDEFAKDADRITRFQREARLLASHNHPNIAAIYGLEEFGGTNFHVLKLVEDERLADQISRGTIPVEESLKLALQIMIIAAKAMLGDNPNPYEEEVKRLSGNVCCCTGYCKDSGSNNALFKRD